MVILCNDLDDKVKEQINNVNNHPKRVGNVVVLPDSHTGYGMPIGCAVMLKKAISPNMVGADIGCGVMSVATNLKMSDVTTEQLKQVMSKIREYVPVGFTWRNTPIVSNEDMKFINNSVYCKTLYKEALLQAGTLGGGNHFIEIQKDENDNIWFMIHCGSRNLGKKTGDYYNIIAKEQCLAREEPDIIKQELTYLVEGTQAFDEYIRDEWTCVKFASMNRHLIADQVSKTFSEVFDNYIEGERIDCKHNYAEEKNGNYLHRKGAVSVEYGKPVLIAGSQGTASYMVKATPAAEETYWTVSHGSGRKMGRMVARKQLDLETEKKLLEDQGIIHSIRNVEDLDEAASCYKDIEEVIKQEQHLIEVIHKFKPLAVIKG